MKIMMNILKKSNNYIFIEYNMNISILSKKYKGEIPFSAMMKNKQKRTKRDKKSRSNRKKKQKRSRTLKKKNRVPPKGVIIRKKNKLYKSNGRSLKIL